MADLILACRSIWVRVGDICAQYWHLHVAPILLKNVSGLSFQMGHQAFNASL